MKLRDEWKDYTLKSFTEMNEEEQKKYGVILEKWYKNKIYPNCICKEKSPYPRLHVKKSSTGKFHLANIPNSNRDERSHGFHCQLNLPNAGYKGYLRKRGITINDEGEISCSLKKKKKPRKGSEQGPQAITGKGGKSSEVPSSPTAGENALRYLLLTWLQEILIHKYRPERPRNLHGRLFKIMTKTKVDSINLASHNIYIAKSGFKYNFSKHRIVVGWGYKSKSIDSSTHSYIVNIPIFSLENRLEKVQGISVLKSVYETATLTRRKVDSGYWVLYRSENVSGKLSDTELIFEPADPITGIPVESSYEEEMINYLVKNERHFEKPLVGNVTELFLDQRPDMVLYDTTPKSIIEVAGYQDDQYLEKLAKKKEAYEQRGFQYIEWDVRTPLKSVFFPSPNHTKLNE